VELERKIEELKQLRTGTVDFSEEIENLTRKADRLREEIFAELTPWQIVQLSRHPSRPYTLDYIGELMTDFTELHGDRLFRDDPAIVGGIAFFDHAPVMIIGHQKGRNTKENVYRNFGSPDPEGYRKAKRLMEMADRFSLPIVTFIDTPGAYPGLGAEERGQAEAIAKNLEVMCSLTVPVISIVIGEGGSGGALALGVANRILMLQYAYYSVISPEGCASILWRDGARAPEAAAVLHLRAEDLRELKITDEVIPEAAGGAHRDLPQTAANIREALRRHLNELRSLGAQEIREERSRKYRAMGVFVEH
jgi:acetyl-CoA carboxylase carboxyl transferase subunit alpha